MENHRKQGGGHCPALPGQTPLFVEQCFAMPAVLFLGLCWFWSIDGPHPAIVLRWLWSGNLNPAWNAQGSDQIFTRSTKKTSSFHRWISRCLPGVCRQVLLQKWCVAEMAIARLQNIHSVLVGLPDFRMPDATFITNYMLLGWSEFGEFFFLKLVVARLSWVIRQSLGCWFR